MTQTMQAPTATDQPRYVITPSDKDRLKAIQDAWDAYDGKLPDALQKMPGEADDNVKVNSCLPIVEAGTDFLFGQELEIVAGEKQKEGKSPEQELLDSAWGQKEQRMPLLQELHINGALARNAFLRIVPGQIKPDRNQTFDLAVLDPATVFLQTAPGNVKVVTLICIQYSVTDTSNPLRPGQTYYREEMSRIDPDGNALQGLPDEDDTWELRKWTQAGNLNMEPKNDKWIPDGSAIIWPYSFAPVFHCQNLPRPNDAWGNPDITPGIIGLNNAINLSKSSANRNNKLLAHTLIAMAGGDASGVRLTPGHVIEHAVEGKLYAVHLASDIAGALAHIKDLREDIDQESHVPGVASGRMTELPRLQSGVAIELEYMTLIMKTGKKRCTYGKLIIDVSKALLALAGFSEDTDVSLPWQSALPKDDLQGVQASVMKKQIGVSNQTLMQEEGYDPEQEAENNAVESQQAMTMFSRGQGMPPTLPAQPGMPGQQQPPAQGQQAGQDAQTPFLGR